MRYVRPSHKGVGWYFAIPLCRECHREQHRIGYEVFANKYLGGVDEMYRSIANLVGECFGIEVPKGVHYGRWLRGRLEELDGGDG